MSSAPPSPPNVATSGSHAHTEERGRPASTATMARAMTASTAGSAKAPISGPSAQGKRMGQSSTTTRQASNDNTRTLSSSSKAATAPSTTTTARAARSLAGTRRPTPAASTARARAAALADSASSKTPQLVEQPSRPASQNRSHQESSTSGQSRAESAHSIQSQDMRAGVADADSNGKGAYAMPESLFTSLPRPDLIDRPSAIDYHKENASLLRKGVTARLLQLARSYCAMTDNGTESSDMDSAAFYAHLALCTDRSSLEARSILARTRLSGAQPFPFGPSSTYATSHAQSGTAAHEHGRQSAQLALELLRDAPEGADNDTEFLRVIASAQDILGRDDEARETFSALRLMPDKGIAQRKGTLGLPFPFAADIEVHSRTSACDDVRQGMLAARNLSYIDAQRYLCSAIKSDPCSWRAWTALCDLGLSKGSQQLQFVPHNARSFYGHFLRQKLLDQDFGEALVSQTLADISEAGASYFEKQALKPGEKTNNIAQEVDEMQRTLSDSTTNIMPSSDQTRVVKRPVASSTSDMTTYTRPGTRMDASATSKRPRVATESSGQPEGIPTRGIYSTRTIKSAADSIRQAIGPSSKVKASVEAVRQANLLSAARTNEPPRPPSSASSSGKSSNASNDLIKSPPRRSARGTAPVDIPARMASTGGRKPRAAQSGATFSVPHQRSEVAISNKPSSNIFILSTSVLQNTVKEATLKAQEATAFWTAVDAAVLEVVQTHGKAYEAIRNGRGHLAIALLRSRGPVSVKEAESIKHEGALHKDSGFQFFQGLDDEYRNTAEVQCMLGRAYHGLAQYREAEKRFDHARYLSPSLVQHMDIYSLTLFHLQCDLQLTALARDLAYIESGSCEALIASGNAFALQREHIHAYQCFQRACLAAPRYAYAYTLAGYEALELGHLDQSLRYFREALKIDPRHWNGLAGLGQIYLHNDKREAAAYYYKRALQIVPGNAVLWDIYGRVTSAQGRLDEAQKAFGQSLLLDASSAMSHVKLAETLLRQAKKYQQQDAEASERGLKKKPAAELRSAAHTHLLKAIELAPEEAHIHLLLAKSYMAMGEGEFAVLYHSSRGHPGTKGEGDDDALQDGRRAGEVSVADLAYMSTAGPAHLVAQQQQIRATGYATVPKSHKSEIAKHLCAAIDLNPRLSRYIKAMGEGARAALRGVTARMRGDVDGDLLDEGAGGASMLVDPSGISGMTTGAHGGESSMLESGDMDEELDEDVEEIDDNDDDEEGSFNEASAILEDESAGDHERDAGNGEHVYSRTPSRSRDELYEESSLQLAGSGEGGDYSMSF